MHFYISHIAKFYIKLALEVCDACLKMSLRNIFSRKNKVVLTATLVIILAIALEAFSVAVLINNNTNLANLNSIINLEKQEYVVKDVAINQGAGSLTTVFHRSFQYSGYLLISGTSTTSSAWIKLEYWFNGKLYSFIQTLGTSGELFFSIPKTDSASVYTGNLNPVVGATEILTIEYHY
jgi:hypothetical protein